MERAGERAETVLAAGSTGTMDLSEAQRHDLDVALNEATLLGAEDDVERLAASLRNGRWDDVGASVEEFEVDQLLDVVRSGLSHALDLFQEGYDRHLDLRIWFDELRMFTPEHEEIAFDDFAAGGVRWWDGLYANDPRTAGHGIAPLTGNGRTR